MNSLIIVNSLGKCVKFIIIKYNKQKIVTDAFIYDSGLYILWHISNQQKYNTIKI